jgi:hypothetical protein
MPCAQIVCGARVQTTDLLPEGMTLSNLFNLLELLQVTGANASPNPLDFQQMGVRRAGLD